MFELIFDLETKKWFDETGTTDPADLGVSIVSVYFRELDSSFKEISGEIMSFWEKDFDQMWKYFLDSDRIIGFNSIHFDVPALRPYAPKNFAKLPHFDILDKIRDESGHRVSLNRVAKDSIGEEKIDQGKNAPQYFQNADPESLKQLVKYCESDVLLTKKVYDFAFQNKILKYTDYWNNARTISVDFSYPADFLPSAKQSSLF